MQEEIGRALRDILDILVAGEDIDLVLHRESWIIAEEKGKAPRLEKARYFSFMNRLRMWEEDHADIIVTTPEAEEAVREFIRGRLGLEPFPPGAEDSTSLLEAWT